MPSLKPVSLPRTDEATDNDAIRRKSLVALDYPAVQASIAEHTTFPPSEDLARHISPVYTAAEVEWLQQETRDGMAYLEESGDPDLHAASDASEPLSRASLGGVLTGKELLELADAVEVLGRARTAFSRSRDLCPILAGIASNIPDISEVPRQIHSKIGLRGEVLDSASPRLGALRRQVRDAYRQTVEALERIMHSSDGETALQDRVISVRADRLVLQVRTELRHKIPGIVHDVSNTDATLFVEPFSTVDVCNAWRELSLDEERETRKALIDLSDMVSAAADDIRTGMRLTARLDFIMARARYSARIAGEPMELTADDASDGRAIRLVNARHPLLGQDAVPISANIDAETSALVITGPNTGGKTVSMKTIGLLALMHQSGLCVPAGEGSILPVFDGVYADVGDQQSIAGSVSTFSSHMLNVVEILRRATPKSLVLLDELGASTDPEEGSALAKSILQHLTDAHVKTVVTTHHRTVATFAGSQPGMANASVDLEPTTLRPTYRLTMGMPGRSYAMSVARRLGLPDAVMLRAQGFLDPRHAQSEDWLTELETQRALLETMLHDAEQAKIDAEQTAKALDAEIQDLQLRREDIAAAMRADLAQRFEDARRKLRSVEAAMSWDAPSGEPVDYEAIKRARAELDEARKMANAMEQSQPTQTDEPPPPIQAGDRVRIHGLDVEGAVQSIDHQNHEAAVMVGDARFTLDMSRLTIVQDTSPTEEPGSLGGVTYDLPPTLTTTELHVRGMRADDATVKVNEFLDAAMRNGLESVRIVHGKGRGVLRRSIHETLERNSIVKSHRDAEQRDGGLGVTVVDLK